MFKASRVYTNYAIYFDDKKVFNLILDNEKNSHINSLESVLNRIQGVAQVYWTDTEDLFKDDRGFMYIDIFNDVCHEKTLKTVEKHISRFIDFWKDNGNA